MKNGERLALPHASQNLVERIVSSVNGTIKISKPIIIAKDGCIYTIKLANTALLKIVYFGHNLRLRSASLPR